MAAGPGGSRARLADVAKLAGVSLGSASRALSTPEKVRPNTRRTVQEAARALGYVRNGAARALALRRSMLVGAVLPTISNPIYADFSNALQKTLRHCGYQLLVSTHEYDPASECGVVEQMLQTGIDGLILIGTDHAKGVFQRIDEANLPYLCVWSVDEASGRPCVGINNRTAMRRVIRHLLDEGHRRFAVLLGTSPLNERSRLRLQGVQEELATQALSCETREVIFCDFSIESGRHAMQQALRLQPRPTAVVCTTDLIAAGAIAEAKHQGLRVPGEISITGFDDIQLADLLDPALTSLRVATGRIGQVAGERLAAAMAGDQVPDLVTEIETELVIRASSGPAPAR